MATFLPDFNDVCDLDLDLDLPLPTSSDSTSFVLLSNRDRLTEDFIKTFLDDFERNNGSFHGMSADLSLQKMLAKAEAELNKQSLLIGHRYNPLVKDFIRAQFERHLNSKYGRIVVEREAEAVLAEKYRTCFNIFVNDKDCVNFACLNRKLTNKISLKHYFTLMFYNMATVKREQGDNCLCLLVVGASSVGKSLLFEWPVQEVSHNFANEAGVGRFDCLGKSILLLHDIPMSVLTQARDMEKLKGLARTEPIQVKIQAKLTALEPIFILGTSNQLLYPHYFEFFGKQEKGTTNSYESDVKPTKVRLEGDINAVKFRYLELMVRKAPPLPDDKLPRSGNFAREHLIVGLYKDIIDILFSYNPEDFGSDFVYNYAITSLCRNFYMNPEQEKQELNLRLVDLFLRYKFSDKQIEQCFTYLSA